MSTTRAIVLVLGALQGVNAWGVLGHATVAFVAQNYVKSTTETWAKKTLGISNSSYMASVASWADQYRATTAGKWSEPFHFIDAEDNPPSSCNVDYKRDCGSTGCSISAIANYTERVQSSSLSTANKAEALKFLIHFLGDVTQPLHDEAYEVGGNDITVTFDGYSSDNLHADWDTYMPEKLIGGSALTDAETWAKQLVTQIDSGTYKSEAASWISGDTITDAVTTATKWASDANKYVCTVVMPNGSAALQKGDLYPTYYNSVMPTIELQIAKAGYRLAHWLDLLAAASATTEATGAVEEEASQFKRDWMPDSRQPLSDAKKARAAYGDGCGCGRDHGR